MVNLQTPQLSPQRLDQRRLRVLLVLAGLFLGTLAMLNILGVTRFIVLASYNPAANGDPASFNWGQWGAISFALAVGVLPYPLTFLCTDLISEFYGRKTANFIVWVGLVLNLWVLAILFLGGEMPVKPEMVDYGTDTLGRSVLGPPPPQPVYNDAGAFVRFDDDWTFYRLRQLTLGAVAASMFAYLVAQFVDVQLFHFWKRLTKGRALWLRNNASTLVSQFVDTFAVITITHFYARALPVNHDAPIWPQLWLFIATGYAFKAAVALIDTPIIYAAVAFLKRYLHIDPTRNHHTPST